MGMTDVVFVDLESLLKFNENISPDVAQFKNLVYTCRILADCRIVGWVGGGAGGSGCSTGH